MKSIERYGQDQCLKVINDLRKDLMVYTKYLIEGAEKVRYEERYGRKFMEELIQQGIYYRMKSIASEEMEKQNTLEEARKILGI